MCREKLSIFVFALSLSTFLWWLMIELIKINWVSTHFISGFIIVIIFNFIFGFEYITKYQKINGGDR